jgi:mannosyltransferase OCH1-like enzyme
VGAGVSETGHAPLNLILSKKKRKRKPKGQSRMDNPEKTEGAIKNGQSREKKTGNVSEDRNQTYKKASCYLIMLPNFPQIIRSVIIIKM